MRPRNMIALNGLIELLRLTRLQIFGEGGSSLDSAIQKYDSLEWINRTVTVSTLSNFLWIFHSVLIS